MNRYAYMFDWVKPKMSSIQSHSQWKLKRNQTSRIEVLQIDRDIVYFHTPTNNYSLSKDEFLDIYEPI